MICTKSIFKEIEKSDGIRISVISRHTLNDGVTPDARISYKDYDRWYKDLSPPLVLVGDYYKRYLSWEQYKKRYIEYIRRPDIAIKVKNLAKEALEKTVTLLCIEENPDMCHRFLLANECRRYEPNIKISHK